MQYYIYPISESFDSGNIYHLVDTTSPKRAVCMYALNEESLYGMCDDEYNVFDITGTLITRVATQDRFSYLDIKPSDKQEPKISSGMDWLDDILKDGVDPSNHVPYEELNKPSVNIDDSDNLVSDDIMSKYIPFDFGDLPMPDIESFNLGASMISAFSDIVKQNIKNDESRYNPIIAREFIKQANFSEQFVNRYGFFIGVSQFGLFGESANEIQIVFTGATSACEWPDKFNNAETDQLHNIGAILVHCGISYFESMENIWTLTSNKWNEAQIATIATRILRKCKLKYTGMHPSDATNDMLREYKGILDLPHQLDFLS